MSFTVSGVLDEIVPLLAVPAQEKELEFVCHVDANVPDALEGQVACLQKLLTIVVARAVEQAARGHVALRIRCPDPTREWAGLRFEVRHTRGFLRSDRPDEAPWPDFARVRELAGLIGGQIDPPQSQGEESLLAFTARFGLGAAKPTLATAPVEPPTALVVDDSTASREAIQCALESLGCSTEGVEGVGEAWEAILSRGSRSFGIVLLDDCLRDGPSLDLVDRVRRNPLLAATRFVMMVPLVRMAAARGWASTCVSGVVAKPVRTAHLRQVLTEVTGGAKVALDVPSSPVSTRPGPATRRARRVLVAEDNPVSQLVVSSLLRRLGCTVTVVSNGEEVLARLKKHAYDLVLLDCQMPLLNGFETARQIRKGGASPASTSIPLVALTAMESEGDREKCLQSGMNDCLTKPVRTQQLLAVLEQHATAQPTRMPVCPPADPGPATPDPVFDRDGFRERTLGDARFARQVLCTMLKRTPGQCRSLQEAVARGRDAEALDLAHTIHGAAAQIGALALMRVARGLESCLRAGNLDAAPPLVESLVAEYARLSAVLHAEVEALSDPTGAS